MQAVKTRRLFFIVSYNLILLHDIGVDKSDIASLRVYRLAL